MSDVADVARRQLRAVFALELRRLVRSRDGAAALLFSASPFVLTALAGFFRPQTVSAGKAETEFAFIFQGLILQATLFFGCVFVFGSLVRGEQIGKTLHHLFLAPVRREVLLLGKYLAALALTSLLFGGFTALSYLAWFAGQARGVPLEHLASGGAARLAVYVLVAVIACAGYGAVFLVLGQLARSPILPALVFWGWEHITFLLPEGLKRIGLIHYLVSLSPVSVPPGALAILGEPVPAWVAVPAPLLLAAGLVVLAAWQLKRTEVDYGVE